MSTTTTTGLNAGQKENSKNSAIQIHLRIPSERSL
jgi:hypothetical protein